MNLRGPTRHLTVGYDGGERPFVTVARKGDDGTAKDFVALSSTCPMMAPDYAHRHGMYEVAERFYEELIPAACEIIAHAREEGDAAAADATLIDEILARPEHAWKGKVK